MIEPIQQKVLAIIPARYESRRFPGKLLQLIAGQTILERVYRCLAECQHVNEHAIVVNHDKLAAESKRIGAPYIKSQGSYICGTDRCIGSLDRFEKFDILINLQADQPFISHTIVDQLIMKMRSDPSLMIASMMTKSICSDKSPNVVKVNVDKEHFATDFFREKTEFGRARRHIGVYGFRLSAVQLIQQMSPSDRETKLNLEQLRWMDNGLKIKMVAVDYNPVSIDVPDDLTTINEHYAS